jgi:hypothetical protein
MHSLFVRGTLLSALTVAVLSAQSTSLPTFWRYSHPNAKALVGIDVQRISESPFGQRVAKEFAQAGLKAKADAEGLDFLNEVERVLISSTGGAAAHSGGEKSTPPAVVALQGKFELARIRTLLKSKGAVRSYYLKAELYSPGKGEGTEFSIALAGPQTILMGDPASVKTALDHHAAADPAASANPLFQRAVELAAVHDVWFASETSPAELSSGGPFQAIFSEVQGFEGGLSFRRGLGMEVNLATASVEAAQKLGGGLQALMQITAMSDPKDQPAADLLKKLTVTQDSTLVKIGLSFDQAELDRGVDELKLSFAKGFTGGAIGPHADGADRSHAAVHEDPSRPMVIKIYNADGGTREIPLNQK